MSDPFGTDGIRSRVLAGWAAAAARFREDANAEEDAARGAYRDRLAVELLQNAVDAAAADDVPARVLLRVDGDVLEAANTGAPLSPVGVEALSTLRASAKREPGSVGRFGVGFAAVLAVSDAPEVVSRATGGVRWSLADTRALVGDLPALTGEITRRRGAVPVLRLPFALDPAEAATRVPAGYDTVVRLPLRDDAAAALARRLLGEVDPTLMLVFDDLVELTVEIDGDRRVHTCTQDAVGALLDGTRWIGVRDGGVLEPALLADRPTEEQERTGYEIRAFAPQGGGWPAGVPRVLRAPQPTDEPLDLPVLLSVPLPLDPSRRHTVAGPLRDRLVERAAETVSVLAERLAAAGPDEPGTVLPLVPAGLPTGEVEGRLATALLALLPHTPLLPGGRAGRDGRVLDLGPATEPATAAIASAVPGLLPASWAAPRWTGALDRLGVTRLGTADAVELLVGVDEPPAWWAPVYAALAGVPDRDALGALPVPLADGRMVTGPRGLLLPGDDLDLAVLTAGDLAVRVVHPEAAAGRARDVLRGLGAVEATALGLLGDPAVRDAVENGDPDVWPAVLALARDARLGPGELPWLAGLLLPGDDGEHLPAGELLLPGGPLAEVVEDDAPFGLVAAEVAAAWPAEALEGVGVLRTFGLLRAEDVLLEDDEPVLFDLDDSDSWVADVGDAGDGTPVLVRDFVAVRDLELVAPDRWQRALAELAGPGLREVVLGPEPSYTRWWLHTHAELPTVGGDLLPPGELLLPGGDPLLAELYDEVAPVPGVDEALLRAVGLRGTLDDLLGGDDPEPALDLLDRLGDAERDISWPAARAVYLRVAAALDDQVDPPLTVRTAAGVRPSDRAVVVDTPDLLPLVGDLGQVRVPPADAAAVAAVLGVPLASRLAGYPLSGEPGVSRTAADGTRYEEHDPLLVTDVDGRPVRVPWRRTPDGRLHVDRGAGADGLGRALAWASGRWPQRYALVAAVRDPAGAGTRTAEDDLDDGPAAR